LYSKDTYPVDQFSLHPKDRAHHDDFQWLLSNLSLIWNWLPSSALATLRSDGFYSAPIADGLRVVALNSQWGDSFNFYLMLDENQRARQWNWLVDVLSAAEKNGERVLLIGHIPNGLTLVPSVAASSYSLEYISIAQRFNETIIGHFYG
jgi:sphingomyelin phosphodiesterase